MASSGRLERHWDMKRAFTRKTLSLSVVAVCVGCSLIYETEPLTQGGGRNPPGKPSGGFSGSSDSGGDSGGGGKSSGGVTSGGVTSGGTTSGGTSAAGGTIGIGATAGTTSNGAAGSAGDAAAGAGGADEPDCSLTYYPDADGDGWGNEAMPGVDCEMPGHAPGGDCADSDPYNNPGNIEYCDGLENDCDSSTPDLCPSDCVAATHDNHVYLFCVGYATFAQASSRCAQNGMRLVRLDDAEEQTWVNAWHSQQPAYHSWAGGSDVEVEDTWKWEDGDVFRDQGVNLGYSDWNTGEPNNFADSEHCLILDNGDYWNDVDCDQFYEFTCERY